MNRADIENRLMLLTIAGSHSYGLNIETSDYDYRGIFVGNKRNYLGTTKVEQYQYNGKELGNGQYTILDNEKDVEIYEVSKYIQLASKCNPNILELLFNSKSNYLYISKLGQKLIDNRTLFLSKKAKHAYVGYSRAQIKKVETHRRWLLNPPNKKPELKDYGLDESTILPKRNHNAFLEFFSRILRDRIEYWHEYEELQILLRRVDWKGLLINNSVNEEEFPFLQKCTNGSNEFMDLLRRTQNYRNDINQWNNYQSWAKNRNKARGALEARIGYDAKHIMHAVRLLTIGKEILENGELNVDRTNIDREYLLDIRQGRVCYEEVIEYTELLFNDIEKSYKSSKLPNSVDLVAVEDLLIEIVEESIND